MHIKKRNLLRKMQRKTQKTDFIDRIVDWVIYASFLSVIIWGILKGIGVINTPALLQQLPVITGGLGLLGLAYKAGRFVERVNLKFLHLDKDVELLKQDVEQLKQDVTYVKQRV